MTIPAKKIKPEGVEPHLTEKVVRAGEWMMATSATAWVLGFVRLMVLARLLTPHDFGLVGIALVIISLLESLSATGTYLFLIYRKEPSRDAFDSAWTLGLIRGVIIAVLVGGFAPSVATFFRSPEAVGIIRAMALVPLLRALTNIGMVEFRKELALGPYYLYHTLGILADLCVALPLAFWLQSAWALVAGWLAATSVRVVLSYTLHAYRPSLRLDSAQLREVGGYGRWVFGSTAIRWFLTFGVETVVGRLLGIGPLGLYHMAWRLTNLPATEVAQVVSYVTLPAYVKLQETPSRVQRGYLRVLKVVTLVAIPTAAVIVAHGEDFTRLLMGSRWLPMAPLVQVLAICGLLRAVEATVQPLFQGMGRPKLETVVAFLQLALLTVVLIPLTRRLGAIGAALTMTLVNSVVTGVALLVVRRVLAVRIVDLVRIIGVPLLGTAPSVALRLWFLGPMETLVGLGGFILVSGLMYLAWLFLVNRLGLYSLRDIVPSRWHHLLMNSRA